ncbi:MAG: NAD(P)-binding domain-containing protein [Parcubacteria group bacterium]|nr:NAD(P)-binding domain-containing protein [Parcubacteria group bacterium]
MTANSKLKVSVCGLGNFGFAIIKHLSENAEWVGFNLYGCDQDKKLLENLRTKHQHLIHHPETKINNDVIFVDSLEELIAGADVLILAVTSTAIKEVIRAVKPHINKKLIILNTAKALDNSTGKRYSEIITEELVDLEYPWTFATLAGGTIASDLFKSEPLGIDIASKDEKSLSLLSDIFTSDNLNVYTTTDLKGVEYAAAFKNAIAILAGIVKGLGFSYGSETHLISRTAGEVEDLALSLGAKPETFAVKSQCWGNDMIMSCTGNTRNREFGILLGQGLSIEQAAKKMKEENKTVEGINTLQAIKKVIGDDSSKYPLLYNLHEIVYNNQDPRQTLLDLLRSNTI